MGWLPLILIALVLLGALWRFAGVRGSALELLGAALLLGIAGYAWQGAPALPGKPTPPRAEQRQDDSLFALERAAFMERFTADAQVLESADAMHRAGSDAYGVALIRGALEKRPNSADLWVGMGNALTLYADGVLTPAAEYAFQRGIALSPDHPAPRYFLGLAYAQSGQFEQALNQWRDLLARAPETAPWRSAVQRRLIELEGLKQRQSSQQ